MDEDQSHTTGVAADEPKTDREWLMNIAKDVKSIAKKLEGKDGVCDRLGDNEGEIARVKKEFDNQISKIKKDQQKIIYLQIGLIILILGRYAFGPTSWPLVP